MIGYPEGASYLPSQQVQDIHHVAIFSPSYHILVLQKKNYELQYYMQVEKAGELDSVCK
jgi:hypothetical protein